MAAVENSLFIKTQLTCSICRQLFSDPVTLPCSHTFCKDCITSHIEEGNFVNGTVCPKWCELVGLSVTELMVNPTLKKVTESFKENCIATQRIFKEPICEVCDAVVNSLSGLKCTDCKITYCLSCRNTYHPNKGVFSKHTIQNVVESSNMTCIITECLSHKKEFIYFCLNCKTTLCLDCYRESHKSHVCDVLSQAYSNECEKMISVIGDSKAAQTNGARAVLSRSQHLASMKNNQTQRIQRIQKSFQSLRLILYTKERELLEREEVLVDTPLGKFENIVRNTETGVVFLDSLLSLSEAVTKGGEERPLLMMSSLLVKELQKHSSSLSKIDNNLPELPTVPDNIDITDAINCINLLGVELVVSVDKNESEGCRKQEHLEQVPKGHADLSTSFPLDLILVDVAIDNKVEYLQVPKKQKIKV